MTIFIVKATLKYIFFIVLWFHGRYFQELTSKNGFPERCRDTTFPVKEFRHAENCPKARGGCMNFTLFLFLVKRCIITYLQYKFKTGIWTSKLVHIDDICEISCLEFFLFIQDTQNFQN